MNNQTWFQQHPYGIALLASVAWALMGDFTAGNAEPLWFLVIMTLIYWGILSFAVFIILLIKDLFKKSVVPRKDTRVQTSETVKLPINGKEDDSLGIILIVTIATASSVILVYIREYVLLLVLIPAIGALLYFLLKRNGK